MTTGANDKSELPSSAKSARDPIPPTLELQKVGSYLGYTGGGGSLLSEAAFDPFRT